MNYFFFFMKVLCYFDVVEKAVGWVCKKRFTEALVVF